MDLNLCARQMQVIILVLVDPADEIPFLSSAMIAPVTDCYRPLVLCITSTPPPLPKIELPEKLRSGGVNA